MKKLICVLIVLFSFLNVVKADEYNVNVHAVFIKDPQYYQYKIFDGAYLMSAAGSNLFANDELVYCLEPRVLITEKWYKKTSNLLPEIEEEYVHLLGYYGYGYDKHNHEYYRVATQHLIWEYLGLVKEVYITSENNGKNQIDISQYKNDILKLVNKHYLKPSFHETKINGYKGEVIELVDSNNVLANFKLAENYPGIKIDGNKIIIDVDKVTTNEIKLEKILPIRSENQYFESGNSQKLIKIGAAVSVSSLFEVATFSGSIELEKKDKETGNNNDGDGSLKGAIYGLYDATDNLIVELITDNEGKASYSDLSLGKYYIKELIPSIGYILDDKIYEFEITEDSLNKLIISYEEKFVEITPLEIVPVNVIEMPNTFIEN